jgi:hypothetical protein
MHNQTWALYIIITILKGRVAWIKSSLLLRIQWQEHHYLYKHGCYTLQNFKSHDHNDTEE